MPAKPDFPLLSELRAGRSPKLLRGAKSLRDGRASPPLAVRPPNPSRLRPKVPGLLNVLRGGRASLSAPRGLYSRGLYSRGLVKLGLAACGSRGWTVAATSSVAPDAAISPNESLRSSATSDGLAAAASLRRFSSSQGLSKPPVFLKPAVLSKPEAADLLNGRRSRPDAGPGPSRALNPDLIPPLGRALNPGFAPNPVVLPRSNGPGFAPTFDGFALARVPVPILRGLGMNFVIRGAPSPVLSALAAASTSTALSPSTTSAACASPSTTAASGARNSGSEPAT